MAVRRRGASPGSSRASPEKIATPPSPIELRFSATLGLADDVGQLGDSGLAVDQELAPIPPEPDERRLRSAVGTDGGQPDDEFVVEALGDDVGELDQGTEASCVHHGTQTVLPCTQPRTAREPQNRLCAPRHPDGAPLHAATPFAHGRLSSPPHSEEPPVTDRIRIAVQLQQQHGDWSDLRRAVVRAEELGVDIVYNWDHFYPLSASPTGSTSSAGPCSRPGPRYRAGRDRRPGHLQLVPQPRSAGRHGAHRRPHLGWAAHPRDRRRLVRAGL